MGTDQENPPSYPASTDLSASRYCAVKLNSSGELALPSAGGAAIGILYNKPAAQGAAGLVYGPGSGQRKAKLGGTVAKGDVCKVDSSGRFVLASAGDISAGAAVAVCAEGGAVNEIGSVIFFGGAGIRTAFSESETKTTGDLSATAFESVLNHAGVVTGVLADGIYVGQRHVIRSLVDQVSYTITPTTMAAGQPASFVFSTKAYVELTWTATGYVVTACRAAGRDAPAAASTLNPLIYLHDIAIDATQDWVLPSGYCTGHRQAFKVSAAINTPVGTISGLFYDEDASADGIDINLNAASDMANVEWSGTRWDPYQLVSATIS